MKLKESGQGTFDVLVLTSFGILGFGRGVERQRRLWLVVAGSVFGDLETPIQGTQYKYFGHFISRPCCKTLSPRPVEVVTLKSDAICPLCPTSDRVHVPSQPTTCRASCLALVSVNQKPQPRLSFHPHRYTSANALNLKESSPLARYGLPQPCLSIFLARVAPLHLQLLAPRKLPCHSPSCRPRNLRI